VGKRQKPLRMFAIPSCGVKPTEVPNNPGRGGSADPASPTTFNVSVRQATWDSGLRRKDGSVVPKPDTVAPIITRAWGDEINGAFQGIYGPTVEATNKPGPLHGFIKERFQTLP